MEISQLKGDLPKNITSLTFSDMFNNENKPIKKDIFQKILKH